MGVIVCGWSFMVICVWGVIICRGWLSSVCGMLSFVGGCCCLWVGHGCLLMGVIVCGCRFIVIHECRFVIICGSLLLMGAGRGVVMCHGWLLAVDMACPACHVSSLVVVPFGWCHHHCHASLPLLLWSLSSLLWSLSLSLL